MTDAPKSAPPNKLSVWYKASRPRSLTATYVPLALGGVLAWDDDRFQLFHFVLALIGALALQISANLINEYFDHVRGSDTEKQQGLGMIIARKLLTPREVLAGGLVTLLIGILIGLYFVATTGPIVLVIGIGGVLAVVLYSAGPLPLSDIGLGELTVFVFMGPLLVYGAYFVLAETSSATPLWASLPIAFLVADIMHANNLRDLQADAAKDKRTLAVTFGRRFAQRLYVFLTLGSFVSVLLLIISGIAPFITLVTWVMLPMAWRLIQIATSSTEVEPLHGVLVNTAKLHAQAGTLYVISWLIAVGVEKWV